MLTVRNGTGAKAMSGQIVILNGAPRAGKSSLAQAIQEQVPGTWLIWGVDAFNATLPEEVLPGIGLRPGGERPDLEAHLPELFDRYLNVLSGVARSGANVVADLGLHAGHASGFDPMPMFAEALADFSVLFIGIDCALKTIMERRNADPQGGFYEAGAGVPEPVQRWQDAVHAGKRYDLRIDMGTLSPKQGANLVHALLISPPSRRALGQGSEKM